MSGGTNDPLPGNMTYHAAVIDEQPHVHIANNGG